MNYPHKYVVMVFSDDCEDFGYTIKFFEDIRDATDFYDDCNRRSGSNVVMFRRLMFDGFI